jgi:ubiquinol-cytochrome c reductase iron-sulfur subunit
MADDTVDCKRRNFLWGVASGLGAAGAAGVAVPFVGSMMPAADTLAASTTEFDLSTLVPGQLVVIAWQGTPVFVVHRTEGMLKRLTGYEYKLKDPESHADPRVEADWMKTSEQRLTRSVKPEYLVLNAACTHLGCIPLFKPSPGQAEWGDTVPSDWPGGWHCPCHGSLYDLAGRVFDGSPAPFNLYTVPYKYLSDTKILIG